MTEGNYVRLLSGQVLRSRCEPAAQYWWRVARTGDVLRVARPVPPRPQPSHYL